MDKKISVTLNGKKIDFNVTLAAHDKYMNEMTKGSLTTAANNFLTRCVVPESKEALSPFLTMPQIPLKVVAKLLEDYVPEVNVELKK